MKAFKYLSIICILLITSCTSDDMASIDTNAQEDDLVGTWNLTEVVQDGTARVTVESIPLTGDVNAFGKNINAQLSISQDPNNLSASGGYTAEVSASLAGQSRSEDIPVTLDDVLTLSSWSLNQGVITLNNGTETLLVNITELTINSLKIEFDYKEDIIIPDFLDGAPVTLDTKVNMSFTK